VFLVWGLEAGLSPSTWKVLPVLALEASSFQSCLAGLGELVGYGSSFTKGTASREMNSSVVILERHLDFELVNVARPGAAYTRSVYPRSWPYPARHL